MAITSGITQQGQIPAQTSIAANKGLIANSWYHWLRTLSGNVQTIIDGGPYVQAGGGGGVTPTIIIGTYAEMGSGKNGDLYFTTDTGQIFINVNGEYTELIPAFSGDVTSTIGSTELSLAVVNPVTFGTFNNVSQITVNQKGLVTFVASGPSNANAVGPPGTIQYAGTSGGFDGDQTELFFSLTPSQATINLGSAAGTGELTLGSDGVSVSGDNTGDLTLASASGGVKINASGALSPNISSPEYGTAGQVLTSEGDAASPQWTTLPPNSLTIAFSYGDVSPELIGIVPANRLVYSVEVIITIPFNGTGASLTVGDSSNYSSMMNSQQNLPSVAGTYQSTPSFLYGTATNTYISIVPGSGATAGSGYVTIRLQD